MSNTELTRDAEALFCVLYKEYLERRKNGVPKVNARMFGGAEFIHANLMNKWAFEDVDETCRELDRAGFLTCGYADNHCYIAYLSDTGIIHMENRFKDGFMEVLSYIEKLRSLLPF